MAYWIISKRYLRTAFKTKQEAKRIIPNKNFMVIKKA
jgi:hypothetical protein